MDGKVTPAAKPAVDGLRFHDQSRFQSQEVTRAFASAMLAVGQGAQSEVSGPDDVALDVAISDAAIVRGVD